MKNLQEKYSTFTNSITYSFIRYGDVSKYVIQYNDE